MFRVAAHFTSVRTPAVRPVSSMLRRQQARLTNVPTLSRRGYSSSNNKSHSEPPKPAVTKDAGVTAETEDITETLGRGYGHVTGAEKEELLGLNFGELELRGPFGTVEQPVEIESVFESRMVGCEGGPSEADEHELLWHVVREERPTICLECGQVFRLRRIPMPVDEHGEHGDDHGHHGADSHGAGHGHGHGHGAGTQSHTAAHH